MKKINNFFMKKIKNYGTSLYNSKFIFIIGPSGCGKTTIAKNLVKYNSDKYNRLVQYTTRAIRNDETDGVDYFFIGKEAFNELDKEGMFIGKVLKEFSPAMYGTPVSKVDHNKWNIAVLSMEGILDALKYVNPRNVKILFINNATDPFVEREGDRDPHKEEVYSAILLDYLSEKEKGLRIYKEDFENIKGMAKDVSYIENVIFPDGEYY